MEWRQHRREAWNFEGNGLQSSSLEIWYSMLHFPEAETAVTVIGLNVSSYASMHGVPIQADVCAEQVRAEDFEAIIIPSGSAAEAMAISSACKKRRLITKDPTNSAP